MCPVVLCCFVLLGCRVLVSFCGVVCDCCRFFPLKPLQNPFLRNFFLKENKHYTLPNTPASNKTMYVVLTYVSLVVGGVGGDALVVVGSYLSWSLSKMLALIARGLPLSPRAAA